LKYIERTDATASRTFGSAKRALACWVCLNVKKIDTIPVWTGKGVIFAHVAKKYANRRGTVI
jgi:hypothetical protein